MIKIKYEGKIYPREFISERSANIMINKLVRELISGLPATKTKKQQKTVSKEYSWYQEQVFPGSGSYQIKEKLT